MNSRRVKWVRGFNSSLEAWKVQVSEMSPYTVCDVTARSLVQLIPDLQLAIKLTADYLILACYLHDARDILSITLVFIFIRRLVFRVV